MIIHFTYKLYNTLIYILVFLIFTKIGITANKTASELKISDYLKEIAIYFESRNYDSVKLYLVACESELINLSNNSIELADYYRFKGKFYTVKGDYKESVNLLGKAIKLRSNIYSETDSVLAYLHNNQGVNFLQLGDFKNAIIHFEQSIIIKTLYFNKTNSVFLSTYTNIGITYKQLKQFEKALEFFTNAELIYSSNKKYSNYRFSKLLSNKANLLKTLGRLEESLVYNKKAISLIDEKISGKFYSSLYNNIGNLYLKKQEYHEAIKYFEECNQMRDENELPPLIISYNNLGLCYFYLNNQGKAESYFKKSIKLYSEKYGHGYYKLGLVYKNLGSHYLRQNDFLNARKAILTSIDIYSENFGKYHANTSGSYALLGDLYKEQEEFHEALMQYNIPLKHYEKKQTLMLANQLVYLDLITKKADAVFQLALQNDYYEKMEEAFKAYLLAFDIIKKLEASYLSNNSKLRFAETINNVYAEGLNVAYNLYQITQNDIYLSHAFSISEMSKASVLNSSISEADALIRGNVTDSLIKYESKLKKRINVLENIVLNNEEIIELTGNLVSDELLSLYNERETLVRKFEQEFPKYYELKYNTVTVSVNDIQKKLPFDEAIIEYSLCDDYLYSFFISQDDFKISRLPVTKEFFETLYFLHNFIYYNPEVEFKSDDFTEFVSGSFELYSKLIGPYENDISGKKIIVIPDAELNYIPFEVLITESNRIEKYRNYGSLPYLIYKNTISYKHSAKISNIDRLSNDDSNNRLACFAPEYTSDLEIEEDLTARNKLVSLKGAIKEAKYLSGIFGGKSFIGDEATESNFKNAINKYDLIHLAMHAELNDKNPMFSSLQFAESKNSSEDGKLNTYEIFNIHANPKLVVLSACNTGFGNINKGEGVMSIARGFVYAGCPSLVITLWSLNDESGSLIMKDFYENLADGNRKDIALQSAKIKYLGNSPPLKQHPYYWAAYINIGNTDAIEKPQKNNILTISRVIFSIIIMLFILTIIFRKNLQTGITYRRIKIVSS